MSQITIVHRSERGFITDFGTPLQVVGIPNLNDLHEIPRYGVWMKGPRKFEVVMTTNSLDEAKNSLEAAAEFMQKRRAETVSNRVERRVTERRRKTNPEERAELERLAGRPLPTDADVDRYLFDQRQYEMREREFTARTGGERRKAT